MNVVRGEAFKYDPSLLVEQRFDPLIGYYTTAGGDQIAITTYGLLRGLIDAVDMVKKDLAMQNTSNTYFMGVLNTLNAALDNAIMMMQRSSNTKDFRMAISELEKLFEQGNTEVTQYL